MYALRRTISSTSTPTIIFGIIPALLDPGTGGGIGGVVGGVEGGVDDEVGVGLGDELGSDSDGPDSCFSASSTGISVV